MNKTKIEWVKNPDGNQGYTWNPITGCLNGCEYCFARKLANGRLRSRYLANPNIAIPKGEKARDLWDLSAKDRKLYGSNPFYPRFWEDRLEIYHHFRFHRWAGRQRYRDRGIFICDMSDLFGIGIPEEWTWQVLEQTKLCPNDRFYLLTKQSQNLIKFSPFPDNCWVGVTATNPTMFYSAVYYLKDVQAKVKYISFEPLLQGLRTDRQWKERLLHWLKLAGINQVIIGAQTKPKKLPKWEWVSEIIDACDKAGIPIFLKNNFGLPKLNYDGATPFYKKDQTGTMVLRQEMPK